MKQYGTAQANHACYGLEMFGAGQISFEALVGRVYDKMARGNRRNEGKSALVWWRNQTRSQSTGMPWLYHCGGVK